MPSYEMHGGSTVYQMCGAGAGEPDENNPGRKVVSRITILTVPRWLPSSRHFVPAIRSYAPVLTPV